MENDFRNYNAVEVKNFNHITLDKIKNFLKLNSSLYNLFTPAVHGNNILYQFFKKTD